MSKKDDYDVYINMCHDLDYHVYHNTDVYNIKDETVLILIGIIFLILIIYPFIYL